MVDRALREEEFLPGSDDRRLRPNGAGARRMPPMTGSWPPVEGVPVAGAPVEDAPGWRVTRRNDAPGAAGAPRRPAATAAAAMAAPEPQPAAPGQLDTLARSPRRVAAPGRGGRGISLLALVAAAVVVVFVLGLAALDRQGLDWPPAWPERPAMAPTGAGAAAQGPNGALAERPG